MKKLIVGLAIILIVGIAGCISDVPEPEVRIPGDWQEDPEPEPEPEPEARIPGDWQEEPGIRNEIISRR